jgi:hypothetical protein
VPALRLRSDRLSWEIVGDEIVVLDLSRSEYLGLNPTGTALWQALADGATRDELVEALVQRFDVTSGQAAGDVDGFIAELIALELLEPR